MDTYFEKRMLAQIEAEKKCLSALKKVIDLCLKKQLHFSVNIEASGISVYNLKTEFNKDAYFKGSLINYSDGQTCTIHELLELIKNYK